MADTIITLIVGALGGVGGLAAIYQFVVRPRVYQRVRAWDVLPRPTPRRPEGEAALKERGLPTAYVVIDWLNRGRRTAREIEIGVKVPGAIVDHGVDPVDADNITAPWVFTKEPGGLDTAELRLEQRTLRPGAKCTLYVGYWRTSRDRPEVDAFVGEREIPPAPVGASWPSVLASVCLLAALGATATLWAKASAAENWPQVLTTSVGVMIGYTSAGVVWLLRTRRKQDARVSEARSIPTPD